MRVAIIGTGYVGLVTGVCLSRIGHDVVCVDRAQSRVDSIARGVSPIHEPGLDEELVTQLARGMRVTTDLERAVADSDVTMIAVGTPSRDGAIDLGDVLEAANQIGAALPERYATVVVKSTVIPGTTDGPVRDALEAASGQRAGTDFGLGMNPEFLTEGRAIEDFMHPDRIVIGADDDRSRTVLRELYAAFERVSMLECSTRTAEMTKYASNALLATAISFSNELANLAEAIGGIDLEDVMEGVHASRYLTVLDPTASTRPELVSFLRAGCGFGGSCLPKDVSALVAAGEALDQPMPLLRSVLDVNALRSERMLRLLERHVPELTGARLAVLGLAFKPDTGDIRESPAIPLVRRLLERGASVVAHDPTVTKDSLAGLGLEALDVTSDLEGALDGAAAVLLVTSWSDYRALPSLLAGPDAPPLIDGRRFVRPDEVAQYAGIGRG